MRKKCFSGYLTIYMVLCFSVLLIFEITLIKGAEQNTVRTEAELAMDVSGQSLLAEYHRELWEQYSMLFVDTSYGRGQPSASNLSERLGFYMSKNLANTSLISMSVEEEEILDYKTAVDEQGAVFSSAAAEYVERIAGVRNINKQLMNFNIWKKEDLTQQDTERKQKENQEKIDSHPIPVRIKKKQKYDTEKGIMVTVEEKEEVPIKNPADAINNQRKKGVLQLVLDQSDQISQTKVMLNQYVSLRESRMSGEGITSEKNQKTKSGAYSENILFQIYVFDKMGFWGKEFEKSNMKYQTEYILYGHDNDAENLKAAVSRLLVLRETSNLLFLSQDAGKKAEIESMAAGVAAVAVSPDLYPLIKTSITFGWAFMESVQDVKSLMHGGKVPILKTDATWKTELSNMINPSKTEVEKGTESGTEKGLSYQEYLFMLMLLQNQNTKVFRTMDIVEMDVRKTQGNENFRIDGCINNFTGTISTIDRNGYSCNITRNYGYQ